MTDGDFAPYRTQLHARPDPIALLRSRECPTVDSGFCRRPASGGGDKHPDVAKQMEKMHNEDPKKWGKEMKPKWDAAPET
jgi:hypothetical protein